MSPAANTTHAALLTDAAGTVVSWNDGCQALFGVDGSEVIGKPIGFLLSEHGREACLKRWPRLPSQYDALQLQIRRPGDGLADAKLTLIPQHSADGSFNGCIAYFAVELDDSERATIGRLPLRAIIDVLPGTFYVIRPDGTFVLWNKTLEKVTDMSEEEVLRCHALDMVDLTEKRLIEGKIRQVFEEGQEIFVEVNYLDKHGNGTPYLICGARIECDGKYYLCGMGLDISVRRHQEEKLRLRERALHATSNGIVITRCAGIDNPIEYVNPAFERITGYRLDEVVGRDSRFMAAPGLDDEARAQLRQAIVERREINVTFRNRRKNGDLFWNDLTITPVSDDAGRVTHFIGVINDVTAVRQRTAHLEHEVNHDALTGLANRTLLWDRLEQAIHMAQRNKTLVATVLIDLNRFKLINDTHGHEAGDEVLTMVAKRLQASVRDSDTVARLSGDEFVLVLVNQPSLRFTLRMIERLRQGVHKPVTFDHSEIDVSASVGVAVYPHDGATAFELVRAADVAMYHAKATKKDEVHFFSPDMKSTTDAKQRLEEAMRGALEKSELFMVFQPRVCMSTGRIRGFESLLRWLHPEHGVLLPTAFLADAEENGLIVPFGNFALEEACAFLARLQRAGFTDLPVSINVSQREYGRPNYVQHLSEVLTRHGVGRDRLEIEMREEGLIRNHHLGREVIGQLRELGVLRTVDAFGDGMSDLNYLQRLPLSFVKMAKVAVHQISPETHSGPMAKSLIDIAHNLQLEVIAECVETRAQMDFLKANQCDEMQGIYFREPISAEAALDLLLAVEDG